MKRELHVFGCSFTDYPQWPIWADWLAMYFPDKSFYKHATGGTGNKAIFNRVINELSNMDTYHDKVFIIQWGSCAREDRFHKDHNHASTLQSLYGQCGALGNTYCYDKEFIKKEFSFKQSVFEHTNQVYTVAELLKAKKINYIMTYMMDPTIENMLGEPGFNVNNEWASVQEMDNLQPLYAKLKRYYTKYNFTETCMTMDQMEYNDIVYSFQNVVAPINHQPAHEQFADGNQTLTPTIIKKQIVSMTPTTGRNLTTSTAAVIIDGLFGGTSGTASHELYEMYKLHIVNAAAATYAITLVGGSGVTVVGSAVVAANSSAMFDISLATATTISALRAS